MKPETHVALIDDDKAWVAALDEYLHRHGISTRAAHNAKEALRLLDSSAIGVALIDLNMPGLSGLDLLRLLRERRPRLAAFLVSGEDNPFLPARVRAAGGKGFFSKHASPRPLLDAVKKAIAACQHETAAPPKPWMFLLSGPRPRGRALPG